jgi:hypothetical protein
LCTHNINFEYNREHLELTGDDIAFFSYEPNSITYNCYDVLRDRERQLQFELDEEHLPRLFNLWYQHQLAAIDDYFFQRGTRTISQ